MRRGAALILVPAAVLLPITGCSTPTNGQAQPESPKDTTEPLLPHSGAPKVQDPLDTASLTQAEQDPCSALSSTQIATLGLAPQGNPQNAEVGPLCKWRDRAAGSSTSIYFPTKVVYQGLSQIYESHKRYGGDDYFFVMRPVQGFPVLASDTSDTRDLGYCAVQVGLTDEVVAYIDIKLSDQKVGALDPCEKARDVAEMAVTTMQGGA